MPIPVITLVVSTCSILAGPLVGALSTYLFSKRIQKNEITEQYKILEENRKYEDNYRAKSICNNANVMRLDIATSLFQSIRSLQNINEEKKYLYVLPINKNYSQAVASLSDKYNLKELSYIYQLYGIIEKVNRDIYNWSIGDIEGYEKVRAGFKCILYKIYGENYTKILKIDIDEISYDELYKNDYITEPFKELLTKLDDLCIIENILKEN